MAPHTLSAALLLFGSGMCGLIYQMVWFQQLKLIFGTSTAASAAVVAIFMAGLGFGSLLLGRRTDSHRRPMALYGKLEVGIALCAALSPLLMGAVRQVYLICGGTLTLGMVFGTVVRVALSMLVLGLPTFLMGGTFPAVSRAMASEGEAGRPVLGLLYGANTMGAVLGVLSGTFFLVERFGLQQTLFLTCLLNLAIGCVAWLWGSVMPEIPIDEGSGTDDRPPGASNAGFMLRSLLCSFMQPAGVAAFVTGVSFFLMEMVWYRMLAPLLGGSTYSFGLILAVALLGIGVGGLGYFLRPSRNPATMLDFALATSVGVVCLMFPFALGDRIAVLTGLLGPWGVFGFPGKFLAWTLIAGIVVFPASVVSGFQFPMLLSLAGRGRTDIGKQVGSLYALNTLGAIVGSIAGGFGLLPLLSAPGCWQLAAVLMGGLSLIFVGAAFLRENSRLGIILPLLVVAVGLSFVNRQGPTAAWRHSGIGFGRADLFGLEVNAIKEWRNLQDRKTIWEADGRESSVALSEANGLAFSINGKCDGNSLVDAPTQIMLGMVSALAHPAPKTAFVVGMGTGCSAGWLGAIPEMERVVVAELEPMVLEAASRCASINHFVLGNEKVEVRLGDAREILLTDSRQYDLIVSEPSNPFRVGIASLFTREFYEAAARRLKPGGFFSQWVQGYEIDITTVKTVYATLHTVFPYIETWQTNGGDLLLVCSQTRQSYSRALLEKRIVQEPWKSALWHAWRVRDVEGYFAHYVANADFVEKVVNNLDLREFLSTDDRTVVEFGLIRTMGRKNLGTMQALRVEAVTGQFHRPQMLDGTIDWAEAQDQILLFLTFMGQEYKTICDPDRGFLRRVMAHTCFKQEEFRSFLQNWSEQDRKPRQPGEFLMLAEAFARFGGEGSLAMLASASEYFPGESLLVEAMYHHELGSYTQAFECFRQGFEVFRQRPFPVESILKRGMELAMNMGLKSPSLAPRMVEILREPFLLSAVDELRLQAIVGMVSKLEPPLVREICRKFEPNVPWQEEFLTIRRDAYRTASDPLLIQAEADLAEFQAGEPNGGSNVTFLKP
ncbi:MAG: fused MFS/spermidine synthase [Candidatus Ozemobacteraceae bacterium]